MQRALPPPSLTPPTSPCARPSVRVAAQAASRVEEESATLGCVPKHPQERAGGASVKARVKPGKLEADDDVDDEVQQDGPEMPDLVPRRKRSHDDTNAGHTSRANKRRAASDESVQLPPPTRPQARNSRVDEEQLPPLVPMRKCRALARPAPVLQDVRMTEDGRVEFLHREINAPAELWRKEGIPLEAWRPIEEVSTIQIHEFANRRGFPETGESNKRQFKEWREYECKSSDGNSFKVWVA